MKKLLRVETGLSLVEGLVAITVMVSGLVAILSLLNASLRLSAIAEDELVAANLAQEGIEIVRAIRDESWIRQDAFDRNLPTGEWRVHYLETQLMPLAGNPPLLVDPDGFYQYNGGSVSVFERKVTIGRLSTDELRVTAEVSWQTRGLPFSVAVEDHLFNWLRQE